MTDATPDSADRAGVLAQRLARRHWFLVPALLILAGALAVSSFLGDSITYDETSHLTAGMSYLKTGDYRLAPDHPPLAKLWAASPLLFVDHAWPAADDPGWQKADVFFTGRAWLFGLNDGERLVVVSRCMMVILLVGLCATIYALGRVLFGPAAGLLALTLAVLSPTLLAHGRLVTTDLPIALTTTLTLLAFGSLLRRVTWPRLVACGVVLGAASATKLSWPLVLPALGVMAAIAVLRREALKIAAARRRVRALKLRKERLVAVVALAMLLTATTWASIWSCYGWRVSIFPSATAGEVDPSVEPAAEVLASAWGHALYKEDGSPRSGFMPALLRLASNWHLLPDAYLFGLAWTLESTRGRNAYFMGQTGEGGWRLYFPTAAAIKTPIAVLALLVAGIVALVRRRGQSGNTILLAGLVAYVAIHSAYVINSNFNIGHRHLLPIYPALFVLAGASATWARARVGRWLVAAAVAWLAGANLWIHPHYLSYFNELVGGPRHGHEYLADSNIDWGQDLKRLADYSAEHPGETIKLSYFGSAVPTRYGFPCELLPSSIDTGSTVGLDGGGLYVISATHLLGVYDKFSQESFWADPQTRAYFRELGTHSEHYARLRWGRFLFNLRRRPPDERIGWSLFVYRLTADDVEELTRP